MYIRQKNILFDMGMITDTYKTILLTAWDYFFVID